MMAEQFYDYRHPIYRQGAFVETVDLELFAGPLVVPMPKRWYALRTHTNRENKVMRTFHQRNISAYFPTVTEDKLIERRRRGYSFKIKRRVTSPLFSGIIFIPDFQALLGGVLEVAGVDDYFRMDHIVPSLSDAEMAGVRQLEVLGNIAISRKKRMWLEGQSVRVTEGPFALFSGSFDRLDSEGRLKVLVNIFGRLTPVTLDEDQIEPA